MPGERRATVRKPRVRRGCALFFCWSVARGSIVAIQGSVPGTVRLEVSIDYLRKRFSDSGETIQVTLTGCTRLAYRDFNLGEFIMDVAAIAAMQPEVLSAKMHGDLCEIDCVNGMLEVIAGDGALALGDGGRAITVQQLLDVSEAYWTEWSERAKQSRQERP